MSPSKKKGLGRGLSALFGDQKSELKKDENRNQNQDGKNRHAWEPRMG